MKKLFIIIIMISCFLLLSCDNHNIDEKHDENNNEQDINLDNNDNNENLNNNEETITDFIISTNIDLYLYETKTIEIEYDEKISVVFNLSTESDIIEINELDIKAIRTGTATIKVKEERSGITKEININVSLKKNKDIDFYNGYYVYDNIHIFGYDGGRYRNALESYIINKKFIYIDDETSFKEINLPGQYIDLIEEEFDKAYLLCDKDDNGYDVILIKNDAIFGAFAYERTIDCYTYIAILNLKYVESPKLANYLVDKEMNKDLGCLNGKYVSTYSPYHNSGGGSLSGVADKFGMSFVDVTNDYQYIELDFDDSRFVSSFDLIFLEAEIFNRQNNYNYLILEENVDKIYGAYNSQNELLYCLITTKNDKLYWVDIKLIESDEKIHIIYISEIELFNEISIE